MDIHAVLGVLFRYWRTILLTFAVAAAGVMAYSMSRPPIYASSSVVMLLPKTGGAAGELKAALDYAQSQAATYAQLAGNEYVLAPVRAKLNLAEPTASIAASCSVWSAVDQPIISVACRRGDPQSAADLSNAIAEQIMQALVDFAPSGSSQTIEAKQTQRAMADPHAVAPSFRTSLPLALGIALALALGQAYLRSFLDTRVETPEDVQRITRIPVIGEIPIDEVADAAGASSPRRIEPFSIRAEAYRRLRTNLQFKALEGHGNAVLVTSSLPGEGKTATATAIAGSFAQTGQRVLLIDCDLRRPRIHDEIDVSNTRGLSSLILERGQLTDYVRNVEGIDVLTSGPKPPNPSELLGSPTMRAVFEQARASYDLVILDSPPLLPVTDATVVARMGAGVVVVADTGRVRSRQLATALKSLLTVEAPVLGVVLNKIKVGGVAGYYGYGYRSRYSYDYNYAPQPGKGRRGVRSSAKRGKSSGNSSSSVPSSTPRRGATRVGPDPRGGGASRAK